MLMFGIDVLLMALLGLLLVIVSYLISWLVPLSYEQGVAAVTATAMTALMMTLGYTIMAKALDALVMSL